MCVLVSGAVFFLTVQVPITVFPVFIYIKIVCDINIPSKCCTRESELGKGSTIMVMFLKEYPFFLISQTLVG